MTKKTKLIISILIAVLIIAAGAVLIIPQLEIGLKDGKFEIKPTTSEPIKGPKLGESGNDTDNVFNSLVISPTNPNIVYVGSEGNGIFKTTDGGKTWQWLRNGIQHSGGHYPEIYDIAINPLDESIVYAALTNGPAPPENTANTPGAGAGIYKSFDGGENWERKNNGLQNIAANSITISPTDPNTLFAGFDGEEPEYSQVKKVSVPGGIWKSTDAGENWSELTLPDKSKQNRFNRIIIPKEKPNYLFTTGVTWKEISEKTYGPDPENSVGLIRSQDNGKTWKVINPSDAFIAYFDVANDGKTVYAVPLDVYEVYKSKDSGDTWETIPTSASGVIEVFPQDPNKLLFSRGGPLSLSTDGLKNYSDAVMVKEPVNDIEICVANPKIVYMAESGLIIYKSTDGGKSFKKIANLRKFIDNY
ncbi:WD40/YVTN/BNR-like repeat-containing protein [Patescibacteria group bacterium]